MSDFIDAMRYNFEARLRAHEGMLAHLGLHPTEAEAPLLFHELKATLGACGACHCPKTCLDWQGRNDPGPPPWCHRRRSFLALSEACAAIGVQKGQLVKSV